MHILQPPPLFPAVSTSLCQNITPSFHSIQVAIKNVLIHALHDISVMWVLCCRELTVFSNWQKACHANGTVWVWSITSEPPVMTCYLSMVSQEEGFNCHLKKQRRHEETNTCLVGHGRAGFPKCQIFSHINWTNSDGMISLNSTQLRDCWEEGFYCHLKRQRP